MVNEYSDDSANNMNEALYIFSNSLITGYSYIYKGKYEIFYRHFFRDVLTDSIMDNVLGAWFGYSGSCCGLNHYENFGTKTRVATKEELESFLGNNEFCMEISPKFARNLPKGVKVEHKIICPQVDDQDSQAESYASIVNEQWLKSAGLTKQYIPKQTPNIPNGKKDYYASKDKLSSANSMIDLVKERVLNQGAHFVKGVAYHARAKALATIAFPAIYSIFKVIGYYNLGDNIKENIEQLAELVKGGLEYIAINPDELMFLLDKFLNLLSLSDMITNFATESEVMLRQEDQDFSNFMNSYNEWMELCDGVIHLLSYNTIILKPLMSHFIHLSAYYKIATDKTLGLLKDLTGISDKELEMGQSLDIKYFIPKLAAWGAGLWLLKANTDVKQSILQEKYIPELQYDSPNIKENMEYSVYLQYEEVVYGKISEVCGEL